MRNILSVLFFVFLWTAAMTLVGCNEAEFEKDHPEAVLVFEEAEKIAEEVIEPVVDTALHLAPGTTGIVVNAIEGKVSEEKASQTTIP